MDLQKYTIYICPECGRMLGFESGGIPYCGQCPDHLEVEPKAVDAAPLLDVSAWLRHARRLDDIPGAGDRFPESHPLWDAGFALLRAYGVAEPDPPPLPPKHRLRANPAIAARLRGSGDRS